MAQSDVSGASPTADGRNTRTPLDAPFAPTSSLGDQIGFDLVSRASLLGLALAYLASGTVSRPLVALEWVLLLLYAAPVGFRLVRLLPGAPARLARLGARHRLERNEAALINFLLDGVVVISATVAGGQGEAGWLVGLVLVAGVRVFAWTAGRFSPWLALPFVLLLGAFGLRAVLVAPSDPAVLLLEALLPLLVLPLAYLVIREVNFVLAGEPAGRDWHLEVARQAAEDEAKRREAQVERLEALQEGIRAINSAMALDDLLQMIVTNAVRVLKAEQSSIGLVDEATGELVIQAVTGVEAGALHRRRFAPGVGVAGWVVQHGELLNVGDVRLDNRYADPYSGGPVGHTTRTMLCIPLSVERRVIGSLCVTHSQPNALNQDDEQLLTSFAGQAALAVYKTRLLEERTRQSDELARRGELISSLMSIRQAMVSSLKLNQVLNTTISRISELIRFDHGLIYLLNTRTGEAEVGAVSGEGTAQATDLGLRPGTPAMQLWEQARAGGIALACSSDRCMMIVPLVQRGNTLGCILLARSPGQPFQETECEIAEQLAGPATVAVDNARLFSSLSQQQQHTAALYRLMLKVSDAPNRRQLAHVVCQEIQQITGARASALLIHDAEQGRFTGWATSGEWADRREVHSVALAAHGDRFVSNVLALMHQRDTPDLLVIHDVPVQGRHVFGGEASITLPLTLAGRIYGLLILKPGGDPAIPDDLRETVNLAVSHCTVALERTELFEQTLAAARQSGMLHSTASEVQASLDPATVVQTTANGVLLALPIQSCEIYILDSERKRLRREGRAVARGQEAHWQMGPDEVPADENPIVLEVLHSSGLVASDFNDDVSTVAERSGPTVLLGRLMGSEEALGLVRLTTTLPAEEFVRRHATFCQTLWMHSGGALERSRLYTTTSTQARKLRQRAQQLTDILRLGSLSAADVPLTTLLPHIATGIARSLGFATVQIGEVGPDRRLPGSTASRGLVWPGLPGMPSQPLRLDVLDELMEVGQPVHPDFRGVYLDEVMLVRIACNEPEPPPGTPSRRLLLLPLESSSGGTLGYLLAAPRSDLGDPALDNEQLEILRIFAQRVALTIENHLVYSELLTNKGKIESVVLSISDGVVVTDHALNVVITNSLADQLLGMEPGASRACSLRAILPHEALIGQLEDCLATGQSTSADVELALGREQRTYQAVVHRMGLPEVAESLGVVLTLRDVTLERATERAKSDFLSIVSHELRTPLNSVMGFLDIVLMGKTGPLTDIQADFLGTAKQESVALQRLINDVLDYSQLQSRMLRVETVPMDLSSVMTRVVNNSRLRMADDQLRVVNNVPPQILVMGDEVRLEQVFKNLLDNAAKFTDPGGEIRFEADLTDETVTISVVDTGCGIPPPQVGNVFDRFFQAENNSNRHKRGLGLGLAICKNIVEAHDGEIGIESTLGVGTTVRVTLQLFRPELYDLDLNTGTATATARH